MNELWIGGEFEGQVEKLRAELDRVTAELARAAAWGAARTDSAEVAEIEAERDAALAQAEGRLRPLNACVVTPWNPEE